jgi:hypothetical protein
MSDQITSPEDAFAKSTHLPPALVDEVQDNPEAIRPLARGMAVVNLYNLFTKVSQPSTSVKDKLEFQTMVNKLAGMEAKVQDQTATSGFSVVINIPQIGMQQGSTIEATATRVVDKKRDTDDNVSS